MNAALIHFFGIGQCPMKDNEGYTVFLVGARSAIAIEKLCEF